MIQRDRARPSGRGHPRNLHDVTGIPIPMEQILSAGNVAETFGVSRLLLWFCEWRGLIKRRRMGSAWAYTWSECERIAFIVKCRRAGLTFAEFAPVLRALDSDSARVHEAGQELCADLVEQLGHRRKQIDVAVSEIGHARTLLEAKLCDCGGSAAVS